MSDSRSSSLSEATADIARQNDRCIRINRRWVVPLGLCLPFIGLDAQAFDWQSTTSVELGVTYTDNADLTRSDEIASTVGTVEPVFELQGEGRESSVSLLLGAEYFSYFDAEPAGESDTVVPRVELSGSSNPATGPLTLEGSLQYTEQPGAAFENGGDFVNGAEDTMSVYSAELGPRLEFGLGQAAELGVEYTYDQIIFDDDSSRDSVGHTVEASLDNAADADETSLQLDVLHNQTRFEAVPNTDESHSDFSLTSVTTEIGVPLGVDWRFSASVGQEWVDDANADILPSQSDIEEETVVWDAELNWRPGSRTSVTAGYGERFFGGQPRFELAYETRFSSVALTWTRGLSRSGFRNTTFGSTPDPSDDDIVFGSDSLTDGLFIDDGLPDNPGGELRIDERINLSYRRVGRVSQWRVESQRSERDSDEGEAITTWRFRTTFERQLGRRWSWIADYEFNAREDSEEELDGYDENRVGLSVRVEL